MRYEDLGFLVDIIVIGLMVDVGDIRFKSLFRLCLSFRHHPHQCCQMRNPEFQSQTEISISEIEKPFTILNSIPIEVFRFVCALSRDQRG